jgi:ABC-type uncharacterized transport system permease subunit
MIQMVEPMKVFNKKLIELKNKKEKGGVGLFGIILFSVIASFLIGMIFILAFGQNPFEVYKVLLTSPFNNIANFGNIFKNATPLIIIGVGVALASKCGLSNLGGDGQFYMGALGMALVTMSVGPYFGRFSIVAGIILGALMGAIWGGIAGFFKSYFKVSEIITTLMLNYICDYLISYLVHGPLKAPGSPLPQTQMIQDYEKIGRLIPGTTASYAFLIAIACVILYWLILNKTSFGYNLKVVGGSTKAALYNGTETSRYYMVTMMISGAFAGLAGVVEICAVQYRLLEGISNDFGFNAVMISLLGMLHPLGIFLAAMLMSLLDVGAGVMQITCKVPNSLVAILKGLIILFILWGMSKKGEQLFSFVRKKIKDRRG